MKKITLIGGAPLSGKTTLSKRIAKEDGVVEISTDSIRSWMKRLLQPEDYPKLFYTQGKTAEEFYEEFATPESVLRGEIEQGEDVEKGVTALLETSVSWEHLVIEGIALQPAYMSELKKKYVDREVECFVLVDEDNERIEKRIRSRGLWGPLDSYPTTLIPKEVEWVILYNRWFKQQAEIHDIDIAYN